MFYPFVKNNMNVLFIKLIVVISKLKCEKNKEYKT